MGCVERFRWITKLFVKDLKAYVSKTVVVTSNALTSTTSLHWDQQAGGIPDDGCRNVLLHSINLRFRVFDAKYKACASRQGPGSGGDFNTVAGCSMYVKMLQLVKLFHSYGSSSFVAGAAASLQRASVNAKPWRAWRALDST